MRSEILNSIIDLLHRNDLTPLMAGGWAVAHHGYPRFTQDFDFIFSIEDKEKVFSVMSEVRCHIVFDEKVATRFAHESLSVPMIDALWIEPISYKMLLSGAEPDRHNERLRMISLANLISMKLHALSSREERGTRDQDDIKYLLAANPNKLNGEEYQLLIDKHAPPEIRDILRSYHPSLS